MEKESFHEVKWVYTVYRIIMDHEDDLQLSCQILLFILCGMIVVRILILVAINNTKQTKVSAYYIDASREKDLYYITY